MKFKLLLFILVLNACQLHPAAQQTIIPSKKDTLKGSITEVRAWWDLKHYAIEIQPDFRKKSITGRNKITFTATPGLLKNSMHGATILYILLTESITWLSILTQILLNGWALKKYHGRMAGL